MLKANNIKMKFSDREVLNGVNLDIEKGKIFGLLGPSGAGKTTLIKILTGQLKPTEGQAYVSGKNAMDLTGKDRTKIGIMMDQFGVYDRFSCYENLKIFADIQGVEKSRIYEVLNEVGLYNAMKTPADKLSKGMRNRLQIARVLMTEPDIIFLDEPTSGLDPASTEQIHDLIIEKKNKGCTIFLTTHNMTEAYKLCDEIALLSDGKIIETGVPEEICRKHNNEQKFSIRLTDGTAFDIDNSDLGMKQMSVLIQNGKIETIHSSEPDLEKVFLKLTGKVLNV